MSSFNEQEYSRKFDFGLWKKLGRFGKPYRRHFISLALVMIAAAVIDAVFPLLNRYAVDNFIVPEASEGIAGFAMVYGGLVLFQAVNVWLLVYLAGKIEMGLCYDIRKSGFQKLQELSFSYYDKTPIGWIIARMTSDSQKLGETISWGLIDIIWGSTMMAAIAIFMFVMNWKLALAALSVMPLLVIISIGFQRKILSSQRTVRKTNSRISGAYNEGITGGKTTKTLVREKESLDDFRKITGKMQSASIKSAVFSALYLPIVLTLGSIGTGLALWRGGSGVFLGTISYGTLVAFISYTVIFFEPVRELARVLAEFQAAQASAERILSMIGIESEVRDKDRIIEEFGDSFNPRKENWPDISGDVEFRNVGFSYGSGEVILEDFNLKVKAGQTIALVGETGSGKSTVVNLACRFYEPTKGEILVDGTEYRERSLLWHHSHLGYVLQSPHLFSGTIRDNIRYGRLDASDKEVENAARMVNADEFIIRMEKGYDSEVGEGGALLSTGEKQLISFARAILSDPAIFVLDEATSSIDTETEKMIQDAIHKVLKNRTSFIIAHRLSTIKSADRILVVRRGKIEEDGTHHSLIRNKGYYYRLYTNQFMEEKENDLLHA